MYDRIIIPARNVNLSNPYFPSQSFAETKTLKSCNHFFKYYKEYSRMLNFSRAVVRNFSTSGAPRNASKVEIAEGYDKVKKLQEHFQKKDGKPVFLKGSAFDQVLYRLTVALSLVGIGSMAKLFYELSVPQKD